MPDDRDQPPLPFDPAVQLLNRERGPAHQANDSAPREVSMDAFSSLLFEEFVKRTAAVGQRGTR